MTVILSIHQPRYSIYKLFDTLMLLNDGASVYHGPATEALDFFASASLFLLKHWLRSCSKSDKSRSIQVKRSAFSIKSDLLRHS